MAFASGKYSRAMCEQCGDEVAYTELQKQWDGLYSCGECFDTEHPQEQPSPSRPDAEALEHPRVDNNDQDASIYTQADNQWELDNT